MIDTVLVFEGQGAREIPGDPSTDLTTLAPAAAQAAIVVHQVQRAERHRGDGAFAVMGQSLGEISALVVAGALTLDDALTLVRLRAELPGELLEPRSWTMASLTRIPRAAADAASEDLAVWVIGENGPADVVVVGEGGAFAIFAARLRLSAATHRELPVIHPYHTPLMQPVAEAMAGALDRIAVADPAVPVRSPTGPRTVDDAAGARAVLVDALVSPVAWSSALTGAAEHWGAARWRDCGPSGSLSRFVWKNQLELDWADA